MQRTMDMHEESEGVVQFFSGWLEFFHLLSRLMQLAIAWTGRVERERRGGFRMTAVLQVWVSILLLYALPICLQHFCKLLGVKFHLTL